MREAVADAAARGAQAAGAAARQAKFEEEVPIFCCKNSFCEGFFSVLLIILT